jgi:DNA-binding MltR family transcriptional regulator
MREEDREDLQAFLVELQGESDRGLALVGAAVIDDKLRQILAAFFCDAEATKNLLGRERPLSTFAARADACLALGLIEKIEHHEITIIRKVRNEFGHARHGTSFKTPLVQDLVASLEIKMPEVPGAKYTTRSRFSFAAIQIVVRLFYRPEYVAKERRKPQQWIDPEELRWRSIKDEPPPDEKDLLLIGEIRPKMKLGPAA